jgi:hypothetical protein
MTFVEAASREPKASVAASETSTLAFGSRLNGP